ncbi:indolepyruvate oxidoreductase subunit beta family protein [Limnohabitans sp. Rim8]|uniref:indolepyruvate oxidoreductase subunit beta family protein n=1 Tax=Limnohabitans sp. Rim8 TaxID=1100718 RepID=UPI0026044778|nr:indolepyruvate oxidoreductase subunit beta family protein [Limnohabitans sp. Rim8]
MKDAAPSHGIISLAILAMGGEGGGVLADWLVDLAEHNGHWAQTTSVPGVAQRTGATVYYIEMYPQASSPSGQMPVMALSPFPGEVDIVLASELMEAGRALQRGLVDADKTTFIASSHRVYSMTERTAMGDGRVDEAKLLAGAQAAARQFISADFSELAEQAGSLIAPALYGALAACERLPFSRAQFEASIERSGVGVKTSLKAFAAGFDAAMQVLHPTAALTTTPITTTPTTTSEAAKPLHAAVGKKLKDLARSLEDAFAPSSHEVIALGLTRLADYQDVNYAALYARRLQDLALALASSALVPALSEEILREGARHLALWMSYEDTVRVADLKTRRTRFERVNQEVNLTSSQLLDIHEFMHPRLEEIADTLPAGLGRWLLASPKARALVGHFTQKGRVVQTSSLGGFLLLYFVASLRRIRPVSLRYQTEQHRIDAWWLQAIHLLPAHADLALEVLRGQQLVKGYGDTHARGWLHFEKLMATLPRLHQLPDAANRLSALRKAALADDSGQALDQALQQLAPA